MTSRRKRPITQPSISTLTGPDCEPRLNRGTTASPAAIRAAYTAFRSPAAHFRQEPIWLPAGLLAVLLTLTLALSAFGAEPAQQLQWRPSYRYAPPRPQGQAMPVNTLRSHARQDVAVRTVQYEQEVFGDTRSTPYQGAPQQGQARLQSIVVRRQTTQGNYAPRVAQESGIRDGLKEAIESPFGEDMPPAEELPPVDSADNAEGSTAAPEADDDNDFNILPLPGSDDDGEDEDSPSDSAGDDEDDYKEPETKRPAKKSVSQKQAEQRAKDMQSCVEELAELKGNRLSTVDLHINVGGEAGKDYPYACSIDDGTPFAGRCWPEVVYMWKASALCHKPLFFEDVALERYGHSTLPCLQPFVSGAHFFGRLPVLPYCMGLTPPNECMYTLGHYRPGSCAPYYIGGMPFTWRAAAFQTGAVVGTAAIIP